MTPHQGQVIQPLDPEKIFNISFSRTSWSGDQDHLNYLSFQILNELSSIGLECFQIKILENDGGRMNGRRMFKH